MKICILGAGSLGSAIGGTLAMGGSEVFLINHQKAYVEAVNRDGLRMTDEKTDFDACLCPSFLLFVDKRIPFARILIK